MSNPIILIMNQLELVSKVKKILEIEKSLINEKKQLDLLYEFQNHIRLSKKEMGYNN